MSRSLKALIVGLAIAAVAQTASAATPQKAPDVNKIVVRYADLNLQNEAGATSMLKRLSNAASYVCNMPPPGAANLRQRIERRSCREGALQEAVATLDHPVVTALYRSTRPDATTALASR